MGDGPWNAERLQLLQEVQRLQAHCLVRLDSLPLYHRSGDLEGLLMRYRADLVMALMRLQALEALTRRDIEGEPP